jgi:hypothetical protein
MGSTETLRSPFACVGLSLQASALVTTQTRPLPLIRSRQLDPGRTYR